MEGGMQTKLGALMGFTGAVVAASWWNSYPCLAKTECATMLANAPKAPHAYVATGLGILFLREAVGLTSTLRELYDTKEMWGTRKSCPPVLLLCIIFGMLSLVEFMFWSSTPWSHAMANNDLVEAWRPVHSFRYFEWLINVPCLIILAGNCALARPMKDVIPPVVITNCYVLWAWGAQVAPNPFSRWVLVLLTFVGYAWASYIMCYQWVQDFLLERPFNGRSQFLRILVPVGLTVLLIFYAIVYLTGIAGIISADAELKGFTYSGFLCKVGFSATFAYLRWVEDRNNLASLMGKVGTMNTTLVAILKSTFDVIVAGEVQADGSCLLASAKTADAGELERVLDRPVAGVGLESLLSGAAAQDHFAVYSQSVVRQAEESTPTASPLSNSVLDPNSKAVCPIAQVLHCAMQTGEASAEKKIRAKIHISPVPKSMQTNSTGKEVLVAIAFDTMELALSEEQVDESVMQMDEAATLVGEKAANLVKSEKLVEGKTVEGKPRRRKGVNNKQLPLSEDSTNTSIVTGSGPDFRDDKSVYSSTAASEGPLGGCDVGSQASKQTYVGSVHMATRQLLGPLMDSKAPTALMSDRIEDHMDVAAEMVRLQAPAAVARYRYKQELADWSERSKSNELANILEKSKASAGMDDTVWFSEILPRLRGGKPGPRPKEPALPGDQAGLWQKAYDLTYEEDDDDSEEEE
ncbi:rhodopsin [Amphidinium carterae]